MSENDHVTVAAVTIHRAADMDDNGRSVIANWLREQADKLAVFGPRYDEKYEAEYRYFVDNG